MNGNWIALHTVPREGEKLVFKDQGIWRGPLDEFGINCMIPEDITAEIFVLPHDEGVLFRGRITGRVTLPCDRCGDVAQADIDHTFDDFEPYPAGAEIVLPTAAKDAGPQQRSAPRKGKKGTGGKGEETPAAGFTTDTDESVIRVAPFGRGIEINPATLAWEEFSLALPIKPLCREDCMGLCPVCGKNRNMENCACGTDRTGPCQAALSAFKAKK
ncbi:MAG: DUF177 domain-containing protein [Desulfovibrio sp.]|nr:DUF177 domain-containing protein [Desulfovibrio sp.]